MSSRALSQRRYTVRVRRGLKTLATNPGTVAVIASNAEVRNALGRYIPEYAANLSRSDWDDLVAAMEWISLLKTPYTASQKESA